MAEKVTFDGDSFTIKVREGFTDLNVRNDLYSGAKEDWSNQVDDLHKFNFPFLIVGGDDIGGGQLSPSYFFLQAPWIIETTGEGVEHRIGTNLYGRDEQGNSRDPFRTLDGDTVSNRNSDIPSADLVPLILSIAQNIRPWLETVNSNVKDSSLIIPADRDLQDL